MASSLLESLGGLVNPSFISRLAGQLGESDGAVSSGMQASFSAILAGLLGKATDSTAMQQVSGLIGGQTPTAAQAAAAITTVSPGAGSLLTTLFGNRSSSVADLVAQHAGIKLGSATALMSTAAPLVLGVLGEKTSGGSPASLASTLLAQKDEILRALPTGLGSMLGLGSVGNFVNEPRSKFPEPAVAAAIPRVPDSAGTGNRWLLPFIAVIAALLILWFFYGRNRGAPTSPVTADTTAQTVGNAVDSTANAAGVAVAGAATDLGAFITQKLPDGTELNIPSRGVESQLLAFINDTNRPVTDTLWFNFDRLNFQTGSAILSPESSEQLNNIAAILKAYPKVNLKIGGYTDNTGNATANMKLSQDRANTVKTELVTRGAADARLAAQGYGDAHAVADNSTADGRAKNRRIAMRVTAK